MRGLRTFYARKHLLNPTKPKSFTHPFLLSLRSRQTPKFYRRFHSTNRLYSSEQSKFACDSQNIQNISSSNPGNEDKRRVWTVYDPLSGRLVAQRGVKKSDEQDSGQEPDTGGETQLGISGLDIGVDDFEENRSYGSAKKANSVRGSVSQANLGYGVENFEGNKSYGDAKTASSDNGAEEPPKERNFGSARKANSIIGLGFGNAARNKKKGKSKVSWVCADCGNTDGQWWGTCRACNNVGTMKPFLEGGSGGANSKVTGFEVSENAVRAWFPQQSGEVRPMRLTDVNRGINHLEWRIPLSGLFGNEVARVLGGGVVPGSLVLIGGDPGVGKSTLLLQMAAIIAEGRHLGKPAPVVYVSGEESVEQIGSRADRMRIGAEELFLYSSTDVEDILEKIQILSPHALVVDSIQTVYLKGVLGSAGTITQVKECTSALLRFAKKTNIPVLLAGHVTKTGDIAGPRALEHIVDVVLYMEGEKYSSHRMLRSVKNRFGTTDELGVFEMSQAGLQAVSNPSEMFLSEQYSDSEVLAGLAVAVIMDGSRTFLIEIQALCVTGSTVSRQVNGIQLGRADMIISVLMKQAGLKLQENAIFLNVVSGVKLSETAGDLAIAASICSSFLEFPIPNDIAFIGEIGLGGELRTVPRMEKRVNTVDKLGYKTCIVPKSAEKSLANKDSEMKIVGCKNLKEVINTVFTPY